MRIGLGTVGLCLLLIGVLLREWDKSISAVIVGAGCGYIFESILRVWRSYKRNAP